ncbi:hypothetical protein SAMN05421749_104253 [Acinetobacter marinus]|uniref:Uncharacterized protein n=1 Tax=Acinetobacter marinus TaxID=281375 RepID=A0A1G6L1X2_9GAMM|nr:hypothetical protein [Acinetobacter marinus]SDC36596.1 hypothetical protein SAMN05421749_104253 [Acinetobacter marinus]
MIKLSATEQVEELKREIFDFEESLTSPRYHSMSQRKKTQVLQDFLKHLSQSVLSITFKSKSNGISLEQLYGMQEEQEALFLTKYSKVNANFILGHIDLQDKYNELNESHVRMSDELALKLKRIEEDASQIKQLRSELQFCQNDLSSKSETISLVQDELELLYINHLQEKAKWKSQNQLLLQQVYALQEQLTDKIDDAHTSFERNYEAQLSKLKQQLYDVQDELVRMYDQGVHEAGSLQRKLGAAELVKSGLVYQLGSVLVSGAKHRQVAQIPLGVLKVTKEHLIKVISDEITAHESLDEFTDAQKGELAKQHLSYRIGKTVLKDLKGLNRLKKLPVDLIKEVLAFNDEKKRIEMTDKEEQS